ncbi:MAG: hypothetical protein K8U03_14390 [Planctomycetia bacterium]|nr:hypothetical protein [Planctomycetia bacterium]
MTPKITAEQREALNQYPGPVVVEDEENHRKYYLVDPTIFDGLQAQLDLEAARRGIADLEAGRMFPLDEAIADIKERLKRTPQ